MTGEDDQIFFSQKMPESMLFMQEEASNMLYSKAINGQAYCMLQCGACYSIWRLDVRCTKTIKEIDSVLKTESWNDGEFRVGLWVK